MRWAKLHIGGAADCLQSAPLEEGQTLDHADRSDCRMRAYKSAPG